MNCTGVRLETKAGRCNEVGPNALCNRAALELSKTTARSEGEQPIRGILKVLLFTGDAPQHTESTANLNKLCKKNTKPVIVDCVVEGPQVEMHAPNPSLSNAAKNLLTKINEVGVEVGAILTVDVQVGVVSRGAKSFTKRFFSIAKFEERGALGGKLVNAGFTTADAGVIEVLMLEQTGPLVSDVIGRHAVAQPPSNTA
jgi:hypothetical protein